MFGFKKKDEPKLENPVPRTTISSSEYEFCLARVSEIRGEQAVLNKNLKNLQEDVDLLRGKLTARLGAMKKAQVKEEEETENLNNIGMFPIG